MGASLGDMNRDGWLDLYLCAYDEGVNVLLRNLSFMNGEVLLNWDNNAMLTGTAKSSFQPVWIDLNNDVCQMHGLILIWMGIWML